MNTLMWKGLLAKNLASFRLFTIGVLTASMLSCGGDSGVDIGSGQSTDPVVVESPIFYIKRPLLFDGSGDLVQEDLREYLPPTVGADLYMRARASSGAEEINLTAGVTNGVGDLRDVSINHDASKLLFSMRTPVDLDADVEDQPAWNIWEYSIGNGQLRRIMTDDITASEGQDIGAQYLPDGRIVFSSTRQNQSVAKLTDQGRPQFAALDENQNEPAFVLHVMNDDGTDIRQISFNQSHDMYPSILADGRIMFSRWDGLASEEGISLYTTNPDGTNLQLLYGSNSHATGTINEATGNNAFVHFIKAREMENGRVMALALPFTNTDSGGELVLIDIVTHLNVNQRVVASAGMSGSTQQPATLQNVSTLSGISPGGRFISAWPLWDNSSRALVSWTQCRLRILPPNFDPQTDTFPELQICSAANLANPQATSAEPAYGLWMADLSSGELRPVILPQAGFVMTDVIVAQQRNRPAVIQDSENTGIADPLLFAEEAGVLHIRSVYDFDGVARFDIASLADPAQTTAAGRDARFVRIIKAVGIPHEDVRDIDNSAFGVTRRYGMREIIGYAPVEPDGSVMIKVPADVPLQIEVLDVDGRRIFQFHNNWLQVRPGEVRECNGCHVPEVDGVSHGRNGAFTAVNAGAPVSGYMFPNTAFPTSADAGETMAQTRARYSCFSDCLAWQLSIDLNYSDVWTDPNVRAPDIDFSLSYADITDTELPERENCVPWSVDCRVIINYEDQIQPLWEVDRLAIDPDPAAVVNSCVDCHALRDANGLLIDPELGRGQLELTRIPSTQEANHFKSYRELLSADTLEAIINDAVQEVLIFQGNLDVDGNEILEPVGIGSPLSAGRVRASSAFFERFEEPGSHQGWLSPAELRLISEWLGLGGQYFNDPFNENVPVN